MPQAGKDPMSTRQDGGTSPIITSRDALVAWIVAGEKPADAWLIGTEHEKFVFQRKGLAPVPYAGKTGIRALMEGMIERFGWEPIMEGPHIIALKRPTGQGREAISLEPGGQFELSGAPLATLHEVAAETARHLDEVKTVGEALGLGFFGAGFSPNWTLSQTPQMPKQRYSVMTRYMPTVGKGGLEMMYRTSTIQVNLDFKDEADMVKKFRVSLALQPIAAALFAASPFKEGKANGFKSLRSEVWRDTDRQRTGMLPFVFESGMSYDRYVTYALGVPMYFVYRDGQYIDVAGASFTDFMKGRLPQLPGLYPTADDWSDHLTTLFPEVRMKRILEMRGADSGSEAKITALPAFWVGLLYDPSALDAAWDLVKSWSEDERQLLRDETPKLALDARFRRMKVLDLAREALNISNHGLKVRKRLDSKGQDETQHLDCLNDIARTGRTTADDMLHHFQNDWHGKTDPVFTTYAY
jgi:glutamate--cysteine ligase